MKSHRKLPYVGRVNGIKFQYLRERALFSTKLYDELRDQGVSAVIAQRRDNFLSAEFRWFVACLTQIVRPLDNRNIIILVEAFNHIADIDVAVDQVITDAEVTGKSYLSVWLHAATGVVNTSSNKKLLQLVNQIQLEPTSRKKVFEEFISQVSNSSTANF